MIRIKSKLYGAMLATRYRALRAASSLILAAFSVNQAFVSRLLELHRKLTRAEIHAKLTLLAFREQEPARLEAKDPRGHVIDEIVLIGGCLSMLAALLAADWAVLSYPEPVRAVLVAMGALQ